MSTNQGAEQRLLMEERVRVGVDQGKRIHVAQFITDLALSALLLRMDAGEVLWAYLPWQVLAVHGRVQLLLWLRRRPDVSLRRLYWLMSGSGVLVALGVIILLVGSFQVASPPLHLLMTMVLCGMAAGAVTTAAGEVFGYAAFSTVLAAGNTFCWLVWGGELGWVPAVLVPVLLVLLVGYVHEQGRAQLHQVRLRVQLDQALQASHQANEARTRFFAAASHDLRQPLTALGYGVATVEALAQQRHDALLTDVAQGLRRSLAESQALLNSLLEISQLDAGAIRPQWQSLDLEALIDELLDSFAAEAVQRGLALRRELDGAGPWWVRSDPALLRRVLQNLLGNALKFTPQGQVCVALRRDGDTLTLGVRDSGTGIPPELQERVFEAFFQVGNPARNRQLGLGLGLAIVRRLLDLLGHPLQLVSDAGRGSVFQLQLPSATPRLEASPAKAARLPPAVGSRRLLVVDDEAPIRDALAALLSTLGWQVRTAAGEAEALAQLADGWHAEALVLDLRLGDGVSGLDLLERLRAQGCMAPAWLVTGDTAPERIRQAQQAGLPVHYKPVDGLALAAEIHARLASSDRPTPTNDGQAFP
ncbi:MAG: response regulator [Burkholderiales bacterium]|uniref:ATP-binding response regulator n=1 Tax=Inhella sp. TaxID=1921806 RepID=UPI001ACEC638|nr:response regulator [Burkholderiales bacterium]